MVALYAAVMLLMRGLGLANTAGSDRMLLL